MQENGKLKRVLGPLDLIMMGVGAIIGVGIYIMSGVAAANYSGPAVVISFMGAGVLCALVAMSYGELAALFPKAGSAYTYSYYAFGRRIAWYLGWTLLLEYIVGGGAVAAGWSSYFQSLLEALGWHWPESLGTPLWAPGNHGFSIDLPAVLIIVAITAISLRGIKESAWVNNVIAGLQVLVLVFFVGYGAMHIDPANWQPFLPERVYTIKEAAGALELPLFEFLRELFAGDVAISQLLASLAEGRKFGHYGLAGVMTGTAIVFFSYVGFDTVSATAEEARDPQKSLPVGIIGSLVITTLLYVLVSSVLTGMIPVVVDGLPNPELVSGSAGAPLAIALQHVGADWASLLVAVGALISITATLLVLTLGLSRIFLAIARDGFLPEFFARIDDNAGAPYAATISANLVIAFIAATLPIARLAELFNMGTLAAFGFVCVSVIVLRKRYPSIPRLFRCPAVPWLPALGGLCCVLLMFSLPLVTWIWFGIWLFLGMLIYMSYGRRRANRFPVLEANQVSEVRGL
jgi:APA family basic amino acid/polyamine antiporter